jgi:polynucleotide 5'-hydroxyl-kinase GRC3/NOL9
MPNLIWLEDLEPPLDVHIPRSWEWVLPRLPQGTIMVLGATDSGKSTFAKYLFRQIHDDAHRLSYLDCDVGQSTLGLPTTLNLAVTPPRTGDWETVTYFVGHISPRAHMLPLVVGAHRLQRRALALGVNTVIVDTTGLVDPTAGGVALKHSLIELLEPAALVGLRLGAELEPVLRPWHHCQRLQVFELPSVPHVMPRHHETRIRYRHQRWLRYFRRAEPLKLSLRSLPHIAVFGLERASRGQLLALQDEKGFALGLGIIQAYDPRSQELMLHTPVPDLQGVYSLQIGVQRFYLGEGEVREWPHRLDPSMVQ